MMQFNEAYEYGTKLIRLDPKKRIHKGKRIEFFKVKTKDGNRTFYVDVIQGTVESSGSMQRMYTGYLGKIYDVRLDNGDYEYVKRTEIIDIIE